MFNVQLSDGLRQFIAIVRPNDIDSEDIIDINEDSNNSISLRSFDGVHNFGLNARVTAFHIVRFI